MSFPWRFPGYSKTARDPGAPSKFPKKPNPQTAHYYPTKPEDETFETCMKFLNMAREAGVECVPCDKLHPMYVRYLRCQKYQVTRKEDYNNVCLPASER